MNKILIIDDDRELCALIKRSVQSENIEADFCNTGREGLQKLKEQEYQLVVLDVMMPGMDGFETLEEIRKENSLPILMFTSKNDSASKVRGLRAGADDYLTKPFDMDELIARIASLIRRYTRFNHQAGAVQCIGHRLATNRYIRTLSKELKKSSLLLTDLCKKKGNMQEPIHRIYVFQISFILLVLSTLQQFELLQLQSIETKYIWSMAAANCGEHRVTGIDAHEL